MEEALTISMSRTSDIDRSFEGQAVLQKLLTQSGSVADVDDVAGAFKKAVAEGVPAPVVISALWEDEPTFASPADAAQLFGNLLGLYDLIAQGQSVDLKVPVPKVKQEKAPKPEPFGAAGPDDAFVEAAWRWFDDFPKERERFEHAFENRQDALVSWLDASGLDDAAFALARHLVGEVFAMLELGGRQVQSVDETLVPAEANLEALPKALTHWIEEALFEATTDETEPLPQAQADQALGIVTRAVAALLKAGA
jgi:hypothetical protein